jgi:xylulokinase
MAPRGRRGTKAFLGIDIGTTAVKALLVSEQGAPLAEGDCPQQVAVPRPGWAEQRPEDWWSGAITATRAALASAPPGTEVAGVGLSGQMHSAVFLDSADSVIRPAILWNDVRTTAQCRQIVERVGLPGLRRLTGNPALEGFTATKVLWLRDNEPRSFGRLRTLLLAKDYVRLRMTGERATEPSDAAATLLFDVFRSKWSPEMITALGLEGRILPRIVGSSEVAGRLSAEAGGELGLRPGLPVAGGGADNASAAVGAGVTSPGQLLVSVGTSGTVVAPVSTPKADRGMRIHLMNHAAPGVWYLMGVVLSAGAAFAWLRRALGPVHPEPASPERHRRVDGRAGGEGPDYETLVSEAAEVPPGADGLTFLPYLTGERTPHADANARGVFCGIYAGHTRGHLARAVLEGVAFALKDSLGLERALGVSPEQAVIVGGGARSDVWRQVIADALETPLVTVGPARAAKGKVTPGLGAPMGAAMMAAVAAGEFSSVQEAAKAWLRESGRTEPDARNYDAYRSAYSRYRSLYRRLKPQFAEAAK